MFMIIMGPPGAGKGTQAVNIVDTYKVPHISTGDMFREAMKNETEMGKLAKSYIEKGNLVPDDVTVGIVKERLNQPDCANGFLLDGFPRNESQAVALDNILKELNKKLDFAINIKVDNEKLIKRIVGRRICKNCGATFHVEFNKPKQEGICDCCGSELIQRKDDTVETASNRLDVYDKQTAPLLDYYSKQGLLVNVNGDQSLEKVFTDIKAGLTK